MHRFTYNVKRKNNMVMIKRYALHSVAIVVLSTIVFWQVDAGNMHCSAEARRAAAQAFDSAHNRHVHASKGKAPSCCHALEARVLVKQERPSRSHSAVPALGLRTQL